MIIGTTIINPAQVVYAKRRGKMLFVTVTTIVTLLGNHGLETFSEELSFDDEDGDVFATLAREIERLSPPRPI